MEYEVNFDVQLLVCRSAKHRIRHGSKIASGLETNLQQLGLDYLDLSLMHFPIGTANNNKSEYDIIPTWKEMEKLVTPGNAAIKGKTRFIGISNFNVSQLNDLLAAATIKPKVSCSRSTQGR
jgi:diketogulonate reductase-like aldo/keto reductase